VSAAEGLGEEAVGLVESGDASAMGEASGFFFDFLDFFSGEGVGFPVYGVEIMGIGVSFLCTDWWRLLCRDDR
jgi:hypothetical protein